MNFGSMAAAAAPVLQNIFNAVVEIFSGLAARETELQ
jgi:hypothetical protein